MPKHDKIDPVETAPIPQIDHDPSSGIQDQKKPEPIEGTIKGPGKNPESRIDRFRIWIIANKNRLLNIFVLIGSIVEPRVGRLVTAIKGLKPKGEKDQKKEKTWFQKLIDFIVSFIQKILNNEENKNGG